MLTKLVSIKNVGRFRNSAAPGDTQLRRRSFIVGPNGYGKTTLCAIVRSLKTGDPTIVIGRTTLGTTAAPAIEILTAAGMVRFDGNIWNTPNADTRVATEKTAIDIRKDAVRRQLDTHTKTVVEPYERRINASLQAFNAGFSIDKTTHAYPGGIATSSYQLIINSTAVDLGDSKTPASRPSFKNTLSAGDRTTLALAFFIADLERDQRLANKIVVFDDPFNSQDASTPPDRPRNHQARRPVRPGAGTVARRDVSQAAVGQGGTVSV